MNDIANKTIGFSVRDFVGLCIFLIALGISVGGFIKVINDVGKLEVKIDNITNDVSSIKEQTAEIKGIISQMNKGQ